MCTRLAHAMQLLAADERLRREIEYDLRVLAEAEQLVELRQQSRLEQRVQRRTVHEVANVVDTVAPVPEDVAVDAAHETFAAAGSSIPPRAISTPERTMANLTFGAMDITAIASVTIRCVCVCARANKQAVCSNTAHRRTTQCQPSLKRRRLSPIKCDAEF
jgi:hypothetical protein